MEVATLNVIDRWSKRKKSVRQLSKRSSMACNTEKYLLRSDQLESTYAKRVISSKLGSFPKWRFTWLDTKFTEFRKQQRNARPGIDGYESSNV